MKERSKLLTIGQFASLHGINKKTLMWYDEIGLFGPAAVNPKNGYRYYSYHQSSILETILLLRELDVSITEIQNFMKNRSAVNMKSLLEEKIVELDLQLAHMQAVRKTLSNYRQNMDTILTMDLSEIGVVEKEECCLVTVDIDRDSSFEKKVELITERTSRLNLGRLHNAYYGAMIPVTSLKNGDFEDYTKLFIEVPFLKQKEGVHIQPKGKYIRAFYKGSWDGLSLCYRKILRFAETKGIALSGYSYEKGINETVIDRIEDYITQIEIPFEFVSI